MCEDIPAPENLLSPEWGQGAFRSVLGERYAPKVWGKHRATNYASLRHAINVAMQREAPEVCDVIAALIWQAGIVGNRAQLAFGEADEQRKRANELEAENANLLEALSFIATRSPGVTVADAIAAAKGGQP